MAIRSRGRCRLTVNGRRFSYYVHDDGDVRIASVDKKFVISYCRIGDPDVKVSGQEFPGLPKNRPIMVRPPSFDSGHNSLVGLVAQIIRWALYENRDLDILDS